MSFKTFLMNEISFIKFCLYNLCVKFWIYLTATIVLGIDGYLSPYAKDPHVEREDFVDYLCRCNFKLEIKRVGRTKEYEPLYRKKILICVE